MLEAVAVEKGLNPAETPISVLTNFVQTYPTLQKVAQNAQNDAGQRQWWEQG